MENLRKITEKLIGYYLLFEIILGVIYSLVHTVALESVKLTTALVFIWTIVSKAIIELLCWFFARNSTIKQKSLKKEDVNKLMKKIYITSLAVCVFSICNNFFEINQTITDMIDNSYELKLYNTYANMYYDNEIIKQYNSEIENAIKNVKKEVFTQCIFVYSGLIFVAVITAKMQKRHLEKYVIDDNFSEEEA